MSELITLNDLAIFGYLYNEDKTERMLDNWINKDILKTEAIEEIKSNFPTKQMPNELRGFTQDQKNAIKDYIKWKNNLTEKDLK